MGPTRRRDSAGTDERIRKRLRSSTSKNKATTLPPSKTAVSEPAARAESADTPTAAASAVEPETEDDITRAIERTFVDRENAFDQIPVATRDVSFPTSLPCYLVVELNTGGGDSEIKRATDSFFLKWQTPIDDIRKIAERFAKFESARGSSRTSYLVSVSYSIIHQQSPRGPGGSTRARDMIERRKADPRRSAQLQHYRYSVHSTNILTNPDKWEKAWAEQFPISVAKALVEDLDAVYVVEVIFRYQIYSPHIPSSCKGGGHCIEMVQSHLTEQSVPTDQQAVSFVPARFFNIYFTRDVVDHLFVHRNNHDSQKGLPHLNPEERNNFVSTIWEFGTRLLAICLYSNLGFGRLYELYQAGFQDINLPLMCDRTLLKPKQSCLIPKWPENERKMFYQQQFQFCAHQFQSKQDHQKLLQIESSIIMPFLSKEPIQESQGIDAEVFCIKIHEQHHEFSPDRSQFFAVKTFRKKQGEDFKRERAVCQELALFPHDHLTPYLTAWEDIKTFNILFPKAEKDLNRYLMEEKSPTDLSQKLPWLLEQMLGLSEGLASIHRLGTSHNARPSAELPGHLNEARGRQRIVCHHDLKPSNVLVFRDRQNRETMKISDFGLAKIKDKGTTSHEGQRQPSPRTRATEGTWEYMSPEKMLEKSSSRPSDVWSLGCIFLVMLLWFFSDHENVEEFRESRKRQPTRQAEAEWIGEFSWYEFWHLPKENDTKEMLKYVVLKDVVRAKFVWLEINARKSGKGVLMELVELVNYDMLNTDPVARKCAPAVCSELRNFSQRVQRNIDDPGNQVGRILAPGASTVAQFADFGDTADIYQAIEDAPSQELFNADSPLENRTRSSHALTRAGDQFAEDVVPVGDPILELRSDFRHFPG